MVSRSLKISCILLWLLGGLVRGELQLNPQSSEYEVEGFKFRRLVFFDGPQRITYAPPIGWDYVGHVDRITLRPPHNGEAEAVITRKSLADPAPFDQEGMKRLTEQALASLPEGSSSVAIVSQEKNPVMIEGKETFLLVLNYKQGGTLRSRSILFLNRNREQLQFQLICNRAQFPELQRAFQASHFSWQNL